MDSSVEPGRLTIEQAVERFRARTVSELRVLNKYLPQSMHLERKEIDRLVENLLSAMHETPKRRNASLLDKAVWMASGVLAHAIRHRSRRRKRPGATVYWTRHAVDEGGRPKGDTGGEEGNRVA